MTSSPASTCTSNSYDPVSQRAVKRILRELGHAPNRTLGQNFLVNGGARDRIVQIAQLQSTDSVLEIGPGLGALTCELSRRVGQVVAIEKDPQFIALLQRELPLDSLRIVSADALKISWDELALPDETKVVANLPYSVSKPILRLLLEDWRAHLTSATLMVQREVADRLTAQAGENAYGPMAIMAQLYSRAERKFDVAPGSFLPPPNVTSSVVHLQMLSEPSLQLADEKWFWRVVKAAFGQRRKQLANTLRVVMGDKEQLQEVLTACEIDPRRRGETLSLEEFALLSEKLKSRKNISSLH